MKPIILLDECVHRRLIYELSADYNVFVPQRGLKDNEVLDMAKLLDCYIVTRDGKFPDYDKLIYAKNYENLIKKIRKEVR